jgi:nucleoside-diphosphate-sugar epimerase
MRVVITGSSGRVGRAIFCVLAETNDVVGIDRTPFATTHIVGDLAERALLERAFDGADAIIHTGALHAPHVGIVPDEEFERVNVAGTRLLADVARVSGVRRIVFTSTTALYGAAIRSDCCSWIDEDTPPQPVSIYHRTKLAAERLLEELAGEHLSVRVLRMSRCFPERADMMAVYRLHRGIDVRDVAKAHERALEHKGRAFERFIVSASVPFIKNDCAELASDATGVLREKAPQLVAAFQARGWALPRGIDRVYVPLSAEVALGWRSKYGFEEVLAQLDRRSLEVLPVKARLVDRPE